MSHKQLTFSIRGVPQLDGFCQLLQGGMAEALVLGTGECIIPDTFNDGPVYGTCPLSELEVRMKIADADLAAPLSLDYRQPRAPCGGPSCPGPDCCCCRTCPVLR